MHASFGLWIAGAKWHLLASGKSPFVYITNFSVLTHKIPLTASQFARKEVSLDKLNWLDCVERVALFSLEREFWLEQHCEANSVELQVVLKCLLIFVLKFPFYFLRSKLCPRDAWMFYQKNIYRIQLNWYLPVFCYHLSFTIFQNIINWVILLYYRLRVAIMKKRIFRLKWNHLTFDSNTPTDIYIWSSQKNVVLAVQFHLS